MSAPLASETLQDEYGAMDAAGETYTYPGEFILENGSSLLNPTIVYNTWGKLNDAKNNCIVCVHALTANSRIESYWPNCKSGLLCWEVWIYILHLPPRMSIISPENLYNTV